MSPLNVLFGNHDTRITLLLLDNIFQMANVHVNLNLEGNTFLQ